MPTDARTPYAFLLMGLTLALALAAPLAASHGGAKTDWPLAMAERLVAPAGWAE